MSKITQFIKMISITLFSIMLFFINSPSLQASSATISVTSSSSKVIVGNTFTVTIRIKSSTYFGTWEFSPSYDKSKFKMISGSSSVLGYGKTKEKSFTYKFKAISAGSGTITVKSASVRDYNNEKEMSLSKGSKTIKVITKSEQEATYSKNNNLRSLSIDGLKLSPSFSKNTTNYKVEAPSNITKINIHASVEDSKSRVSGTGSKEVSEGENKFNIVVTAQNGSKKTYVVTVNVIDTNPIEVTIDNNKYTVVKRESNLPKTEGFKKTTTKINEQTIPCFYNETNDYTLVGLKDSNSEIKLYIYDNKANTYTLYENAKLSQMNIVPLDIDSTYKPDEKRTTITIGDIEFDAIKLSSKGLYILKARNLDTANDEYYEYDEETNTLIRYIDEEKKETNTDEQINKYKKMIVLLSIETVAVILILICILISKMKKNKRRKQRIEEEKRKQEILQRESNNSTRKKTTKKKEVLKNEKKKKN